MQQLQGLLLHVKVDQDVCVQPSRRNGFKLFFKLRSFPIFYAPERVAQFLASYFGELGKFSIFFFIIFLARTDLERRSMENFMGHGILMLQNKHSPSTQPTSVLCVLYLRCFFRLWKNNCVSRNLYKRKSDLVLNGQIRAPK